LISTGKPSSSLNSRASDSVNSPQSYNAGNFRDDALLPQGQAGDANLGRHDPREIARGRDDLRVHHTASDTRAKHEPSLFLDDDERPSGMEKEPRTVESRPGL
jgi:hypothetical protein